MSNIDPKDALDALTNPISAGIIGSFISLRWAPGKTFTDRVFNVAASVAIVWYGSPAANDFFNIRTESMACFMGFAIGCLGLNSFAKIFEGIKQLKLALILTKYLDGALSAFATFFSNGKK